MKTKVMILVGLIIGALFFHFLNRYFPSSTVPNIVLDTVVSSKDNSAFDALLGGYQGFSADFNQNDINKDTLNFTITYAGSDKIARIEYKAKKINNDQWLLLSSDTLSVSEE